MKYVNIAGNIWTGVALAMLVGMIVGNVYYTRTHEIRSQQLPMPPDGRAVLAHFDTCPECQATNPNGKEVGLCEVAFELFKDAMAPNKDFRFLGRDGWTYDGPQIAGWYWSVKKQEWVTR